LLIPLDIHPVRSSPGVEEDRDEVQVDERFRLFERFAWKGGRGEEGGDAVEGGEKVISPAVGCPLAAPTSPSRMLTVNTAASYTTQ
jgi:hypothetical protein